MAAVQVVTTRLGRVWESVLDLVFTKRCVGCRREGEYLCPGCLQGARPLQGPLYPWASAGQAEPGAREEALDAVYAPFAFQGVVRDAVHQLKYAGLQAVAPSLGAIMAQHALRHGVEADLIVPVPLHPRRLRARGYNQAALLARAVSQRLGAVAEPRLLLRSVESAPQARAVSMAARRENVRGAFVCRAALSGQRILVVDDVCTTGATLNACAAALKQAGAGGVTGLAFAHEL